MPSKVIQQKSVEKDRPIENISKQKDLQKDEVKKDLIIIERGSPPFSLQHEISKINIFVPFKEIMRNPEYRG